MALSRISGVGAATVVAAAAGSSVRSHVVARVVGGLGIGRGARSLSTAPPYVATNLRPDLNSIRPTTTTFPAPTTTTTTPLAVTDRQSTARSELYRTHTFSSHTRREYATMASATSFFDFKPKDKKGQPYDLSKLNGKVVLVVNTASKCGFTPQFEGLEKLYKEMKAKHPDDFEILGFPCNQFGGQDPGSNDEIQEFCQVNYGVSFPVLGKIDVNGSTADPAFEWLKNEKPGIMGLKRVKWNFEKFLVGRDGKVKGRWASTKKPEDLKADIEKELAASK